jgi:hypothetical protein
MGDMTMVAELMAEAATRIFQRQPWWGSQQWLQFDGGGYHQNI